MASLLYRCTSMASRACASTSLRRVMSRAMPIVTSSLSSIMSEPNTSTSINVPSLRRPLRSIHRPGTSPIKRSRAPCVVVLLAGRFRENDGGGHLLDHLTARIAKHVRHLGIHVAEAALVRDVHTHHGVFGNAAEHVVGPLQVRAVLLDPVDERTDAPCGLIKDL